MVRLSWKKLPTYFTLTYPYVLFKSSSQRVTHSTLVKKLNIFTKRAYRAVTILQIYLQPPYKIAYFSFADTPQQPIMTVVTKALAKEEHKLWIYRATSVPATTKRALLPSSDTLWYYIIVQACLTEEKSKIIPFQFKTYLKTVSVIGVWLFKEPSSCHTSMKFSIHCEIQQK